MKSPRLLLAALLAIFAVVLFCASADRADAAGAKRPEVESRIDPEADLSGDATYSWRRGEDLPDDGGPLAPGSAFERKLRKAGDRALSAKGYERAPGDEPDLWIVYHVIPRDRMYIEGEGYKVGRWLKIGTAETTYRSFLEGTLVLDVVDAESNELIWTGWSSDLASDPKGLARTVDGVTEAILGELPAARK